jgi:hypothetical protein
VNFSLPKGLHRLGDLVVEPGDGGLESLDELQVHLLNALGMSVDLTHELLSCACELTQGIDLRRRDEAALDGRAW